MSMKDVRPEFTPAEYFRLRYDADRFGISLKQLVHDRAVGIDPETTPLNLARTLSLEMAACREVLNEIVRRETEADIRLYEDDVIRMQAAMDRIEERVDWFTGLALKAVKSYGDSDL